MGLRGSSGMAADIQQDKEKENKEKVQQQDHKRLGGEFRRLK